MATNYIYSAMAGTNDPMFGKFEHPIKALIEDEADQCKKEGSILKELFNIETSSNYGETIMGQSGFGPFQAKEEGQEAENDGIQKTFDNIIYHVEYGKEFVITRKMAADAKTGPGANMKQIPRNFVRAYENTKSDLGVYALVNATKADMVFNRANIDLTVGDGKPLFHNIHPFFKQKGSQSNYFYGDLTTDASTFAKKLAVLSNRFRNIKDEQGRVMGYVADTLIIPGNRPELEEIAKIVVGTERSAGTQKNDINMQYGNWKIVVMPQWESEVDEIMIMSDRANKQLLGNMFFNREKLDITSWVDKSTRNYHWNGYCRMGCGFGGWKHIMRCVNSSSAVTNATNLDA